MLIAIRNERATNGYSLRKQIILDYLHVHGADIKMARKTKPYAPLARMYIR